MLIDASQAENVASVPTNYSYSELSRAFAVSSTFAQFVGVEAPVNTAVLANSDDSQSWFWQPVWQAGEREADADIIALEGMYHHDDEDFLNSL